MLMYAMGALVGIAIVGIAAVTRVKSEHRIRSSIRSDDQSELLQGKERIRRSRAKGGVRDEKGLLVSYYPDVKTLYDAFQKGRQLAGDGNCLGVRQGDNGPYVWESYNQVWERALNFASGLRALGLTASQSTFVGVYSQNRPEWNICEQAVNATSMVLVPLYDTLGPDVVEFILNQADIVAVVCDPAKLPNTLNAAPKCKSVKVIVCMGPVTAADKAKAPGVNVISFADVEALGRQKPLPPVPPKPSDFATVCYTSGTTGEPKGAVLTHGNLISDTAGCIVNLMSCNLPQPFLTPADVHISYLPLAHMFERFVQCWLFQSGAQIGFFRGDIKGLMADVQALRPTIFPSVPRLLNKLYDKVNAGVAAAGPVKKWLFKTALNAKKAELEQGIVRNNSIWDLLVFRKIQKTLGGRVRMVTTGAAPISNECLTFLRCALGVPVVEGYGQTECTAAATITLPHDFSAGTVGCPIPSNEIKLADVPEMNYLSKNDTGEVCYRGNNVMVGYLKQKDKTAEAIDSDGWLHSGDIGKWMPNGALKIIDRKKAIFKLAQGEYIAPEKIEQIYVRSNAVAQCFVYGNSLASSLVAVVVPDPETLQLWVKQNVPEADGSRSYAELCADPRVEKAILADLHAQGKAAGLHSFEQVRTIRLTTDVFTVENNLLTPTFKAKRPQLQIRFQKDIDSLYSQIGELH